MGLSPRTRGNLDPDPAGRRLPGPIPADAGEPGYCRGRTASIRAYPRGRGGTQDVDGDGLAPLGPIPADAGEPVIHFWNIDSNRAYPRGRGGTGDWTIAEPSAGGLSPRTRGNRPQQHQFALAEGPIPADAGEPLEVKPMTPKGKLKKSYSQFVKEIELAASAGRPTSHPSRPVLAAALRDERGRRRQFRCCRARQ